MKYLALVLLLALGASAEKARYDNYRVYHIQIETEEQLALFKEIDNYPDGYKLLDFPAEVGKNLELVVPPHKFGEFSEFIEKYELQWRLLTNNLQELIDNEQPKRQRKNLDWTRYWNYDEHNTWVTNLAATNPSVTRVVVGRSHQNREIFGMKMNIGGGTKKIIVLEGTHHSREWISAATLTWIVNTLLTSTNTEIQELARRYEWHVFPLTNPDGYVYTWTTDRMWRKTRMASSAICVGVDPNRNWDSHHREQGASTNACSDTYAGAAPFDQPETKALSDYVASIRTNLYAYLSIHAYGQMMMHPFGWSTNRHARRDELYAVAEAGVNRLRARYGTVYTYGSIAETIYRVSGSSVDWVDEKLNCPLMYAYETRDTGRNGFQLPADQIVPNAQEILDSILGMDVEARRRGI